MRAPLREERQDWSYVAISKIEELRRVDILDSEISIGSCVTHAELALSLAPLPECWALAQAAARIGQSGDPLRRHGGRKPLRLHFRGPADLIPALICLEAEVELATPKESRTRVDGAFSRVRTNLNLAASSVGVCSA